MIQVFFSDAKHLLELVCNSLTNSLIHVKQTADFPPGEAVYFVTCQSAPPIGKESNSTTSWDLQIFVLRSYRKEIAAAILTLAHSVGNKCCTSHFYSCDK